MQEEMTIEEFTNLEEQIDEERVRISQIGRPANEQNYNEWRKERDERRKKIRSEKEKELAGKATGIQIFKNSNMVIQDDEGAADDLKVGTNEENIDVNAEIIEKDSFFKYDHQKIDGK